MDKYSDYQEFKLKLQQLTEQKDYQQAVDLINHHDNDFPEYDFDLSCRLIELFEYLGNIKKRMGTINQGHKKGYFYFLHPDLSRYQEIADNRGFTNLYETDQKLRMEANRKSRVKYEVILPEEYSADKIYPALMIFHDQASNLETCKQNWDFPQPVRERFILIFFQSYLHYDYSTYSWASFDPRVREEVKESISQIKSEYPVNHNEIYLTGVGAGANSVIDLVMNNIISVNGFISWFPTQNGYFDLPAVNEVASRGVKGVIIVNQNDADAGKFKKLIQVFQDSGFHYEIILKKETRGEFKNVFKNDFPELMINLNIESD